MFRSVQFFGFLTCVALIEACSGAAGSYQAVNYERVTGGYTATLKTRGLGIIHTPGFKLLTVGTEDVVAFYEGTPPAVVASAGLWVRMPDAEPLHLSRQSRGIALGTAPAFAGLNVGLQFTTATRLPADDDVEFQVRSTSPPGLPEFICRRHPPTHQHAVNPTRP